MDAGERRRIAGRLAYAAACLALAATAPWPSGYVLGIAADDPGLARTRAFVQVAAPPPPTAATPQPLTGPPEAAVEPTRHLPSVADVPGHREPRGPPLA